MEARVRRARAEDVEEIHSVMTSAFGVEPGSERWESWRRLAEGWRDFLVMELGGRIVGAVRIKGERLRYGENATIIKGDVGYVSVRRELQGRGLGTRLMGEAVRFMREEGMHISRLGGLIKFYSRFGYVPFPRRFYEFPLDPARAGAATIPPEEYLALPSDEEARIRPYEPGRDWRKRWELYKCFNRGLIGPIAEPSSPRPESGGPDESGLRWVYEEDGLRGYVFAHRSGDEAEIHGAFDLSHPSALPSLVRKILIELRRRDTRRVLGRLPFDHEVERRLVEGGVGFLLREVCSYPASNMLLLIDLKRFVEAAAPEWSERMRRRIGSPPWTGKVELRVGGQAAEVEISSEGVGAVEGRSEPDVSLAFDPRDFLLMALGYRGFDEIAGSIRGHIPSRLASLLSALFRREPTAAGPLG